MGMNHELYISTGSEERIKFSIAFGVSRRFCNRSFGNDDRFECVVESLKKGFERAIVLEHGNPSKSQIKALVAVEDLAKYFSYPPSIEFCHPI